MAAFAALVLLALVASTAVPQIPGKMNYQVMLTDDTDEPLADQEVVLFFTIYDDPDAGTLLWSELHEGVMTNSIGVASVVLGSTSPLTTYAFEGPRWMQVAVNGQTLSPRREMVSAPYAISSDNANMLGGVTPEEYVQFGDLNSTGVINDEGNPVDWTMLKNVPAGFADGSDDEGSGGSGDGHSLDASDGSPTDVVYVDHDGIVEIGGGGEVRVFADGAPGPAIDMYAMGTHGGNIDLHEESGFAHTVIEADYHGAGGYFKVHDGNGGPAFFVDGSHTDGNALVGIEGASSSVYFNTSNTGDSAVELPINSVTSAEIGNEAGISANNDTGDLVLDGSVQTVVSRSILCPSAGYVLAIGTTGVEMAHTTGSNSICRFGVSSSSSAFASGGDVSSRIDAATPTGVYGDVVTVQRIFDATVGLNTFYFLAEELSAYWTVGNRSLSLVFFPTYYAIVSGADLGPMSGTSPGTSEMAVPATEADLAAERAAAEDANNARIAAELAAMEARIAEIRASMDNNGR
jgi:hypothetical protein